MKSEEIIWIICILIIVIIGLFVQKYKDGFTKWILIVLWLLYIPGVIYCTYVSFTQDKLNDRILWIGFAIIFIYKMYRNRYMIMKE